MLDVFAVAHAQDPAEEAAIALYRAHDPVGAATALAALEPTPKVRYYLAKSLDDLGLYTAATRWYVPLAELGPSDPYFEYVLPRLDAIARRSGDFTDLAAVLPESIDAVPRQMRGDALWLRCEGPAPADVPPPQAASMLAFEEERLRELTRPKKNAAFAAALGPTLLRLQADALAALPERTPRPVCP